MVRGGFRNEVISVVRVFGKSAQISWRHPYILRLTFSAGIGALLLGYFIGIISIACFYARDGIQSALHEIHVIMAIVGGMCGAALGGWMNDTLGRKPSILIADFSIFLGAILMALPSLPSLIVFGTILVGLGVGLASMTAPIYISEASPLRIRAALVSTNGLFIAFGQYLSYHINFTKAPRTWHLMLGVAWFPALIQFILLLTVPESPKWLYMKREKTMESSSSILAKIRSAWSTPIVRRGLVAGIGLRVVQQFVGIDMVMHYMPNMIELDGNKTLLKTSLIKQTWEILWAWLYYFAATNVGRRKPLVGAMCGIIACLFGLSVMFILAAEYSPAVSRLETTRFGNYTCSTYMTAPDAASWKCMKCLQAPYECGFCAIKGNTLKPGACLTAHPREGGQASCLSEGGNWFLRACPRESYGSWAFTILYFYNHLYLRIEAITVIVNSDIYPLKHRGVCGGMAGVAYWFAYLILVSFISFTTALGSGYIFLLLGLVSCLALAFIDLFVPKTEGLPLEPYVDGWL